MTDPLFRNDSYLREAYGQVTGHTEDGGIILDRSLFYPTGGGQPGDSGYLETPAGRIVIEIALKGQEGAIVLRPAQPGPLPPVGTETRQVIDWDRRYRHMRVHTGLHLLSVVIPLPVTGGQIGTEKGRLDFDM
ncbi:MAG: alanyl-tRNA editing protein, partial [Rhodobacteraceae bacterium]|nr:alanyl-tRNA editing protein [Paracoccaceae bacterium]